MTSPIRTIRSGTGFWRLGLGTSFAAACLLLVSATAADARCSQRVILYGTSWCPSCRQVRAILSRNKIRYTLLDADNRRVQADMIARFGDTAVPRTVIGRSVVVGADEARIRRLCR